MLFNTIDFAIFLPIVFVLYWFAVNKNLKFQNILIVCSSYIFYGWWNWRFLSLIAISTLVDYIIGRLIPLQITKSKRITLLLISIFVNLGMLGFFKYYNFFLDNFITMFSFCGSQIGANSLEIILPVGISFYTFQTLSYTIDVYKRKLKPTKDFIAFSAFVCFFPQLVAGPIERATQLLSQFTSKRKFNYSQAIDGVRQILWGLFKKIVIADNCAEYANLIFNNYGNYSGSTLFVGAILFSFQIYGDFSGYSDIAIGTSRLFGFNLMQNFAFPYFSRSIAEFWRRWHISLSTWFRDYLYIPLGGSRGGSWIKIRNTFIIFIVSGFWHGANWTFITWGTLNAIYFLPLLLTNKNRNYIEVVAKGRCLPNMKEVFNILSTFCLTVFAWIFFRSESMLHAGHYLAKIFSISFFKIPEVRPKILFFLILFFLLIEWISREKKHGLESIKIKVPLIRWLFYYIILIAIIYYSQNEQEFIYFQF